jgi:hypothetical protein
MPKKISSNNKKIVAAVYSIEDAFESGGIYK